MKNKTIAVIIIMIVGIITISTVYGKEELMPMSSINFQENITTELFTEFEGKMLEKIPNTEETIIRLEDQEGMLIDLIVGESTVVTDSQGIIEVKDLEKGNHIKAYYVLPQIMTMQYPMKVTTSVVVRDEEEKPGDVFVGMLDENNLATDGSLKVNVYEDSIIIDEDGKAFDGDLTENVVIVYYSMQTRGLPPQTNPEKIVVLKDMETQLDARGSYNQEKPQDYIDSSYIPKMTFFINGEYVEGARAYVKDEVTMVPLRALCEKMGYVINWDDVAKSISIGNAITMDIGVNEYTIGNAMPISLEAAPEIVGGSTFVPMSFFTDVADAEIRVDSGVFDITFPK